MSLTSAEWARFQSKTQPSGECLVWTGYKDRDGYGSFLLRLKHRKAHRIAYYHAFGPIPKGCVVHHTCKTRGCVNAAHLRLATARDNALRESNNLGALNAAKVHCPKGHPYDRKYGGTRYCSICEAAKSKRLRAKWKAEREAFTDC